MKIPYEAGCPRCESTNAEAAFKDRLHSLIEDMGVKDRDCAEFFITFNGQVETMAYWVAADAEDRCRANDGKRCEWHTPQWID